MNVDEIYQKIAQDISDTIKAKWCVAIVIFVHKPGGGELECVYIKEPKIRANNYPEHDFDVSYETQKAFNNLHEITTEGGENKWNIAKFILWPAGEFRIKFEWDQGIADKSEVNPK